MLNHSFERADSLSVDDGVAVENPQDMMDLLDAATWDGVVSMDGDTANNDNNNNNNNNNEEERGDDGDWSSGSLSGTGILILPRGLQIDNNNNNNVNNTPMSPMNLSLPSSVPSTMESLMLDNNNNPAPPPQAHDANHHDARTQPPPFQATNQLGQEQQQQQQQQQFRLASLLLGGCLLFLVTVTPTLYLIWERNEMRSTALRLAEQVQLLQVQVQQEQQDKIRPKTTTKPPPYTPPPPPQPAGPSPSSPIFSWEAAPPPSSGSNCPDGTVLPKVNNQIDTCWVRANANFELGECAVETTKTVKKKLKKLGKKLCKTLWRAQEEFIIKMQDMKQQYADRQEAFFLDVFNKDNNNDKSTFTDSDNNNNNSNKVNGSKNKNKERLHKIGKTATAVLSGVAFASAAALIISGSFLSNFVNDPEQDD